MLLVVLVLLLLLVVLILFLSLLFSVILLWLVVCELHAQAGSRTDNGKKTSGGTEHVRLTRFLKDAPPPQQRSQHRPGKLAIVLSPLAELLSLVCVV